MRTITRACRECGANFDTTPRGGEHYGQQYCSAHRPRTAAQTAAGWRKAHPERALEHIRRGSLKRNYGITLEQARSLYAAQGGKCALCLSPVPFDGRGRAIDHDHETGKVRGILCQPCNQALGWLSKLPCSYKAWVARVASYL